MFCSVGDIVRARITSATVACQNIAFAVALFERAILAIPIHAARAVLNYCAPGGLVGLGGLQIKDQNRRAWERSLRPKPCRLTRHAELRWRVAQKLALQWSPKQISGWLKQQFPADPGMQVSHETIYRSLFIQTRGVLKKELMAHLRTARQMRQAKSGTTKNGLGQIVDAVSIRERPAEVEDRAVPGHWEGDLLSGANNTHIATLVERHTRFVMLLKVPSKDTTTVVATLAQHVRKLPQELRRSLTWDRGKEMADHKRFTVATNVQVYFCDPRSPWQRGSNENTNGLLRQYFPKGTDLSQFSQAYLNKIAKRLNQRPRETLGFETPAGRRCRVAVSLGRRILRERWHIAECPLLAQS